MIPLVEPNCTLGLCCKHARKAMYVVVCVCVCVCVRVLHSIHAVTSEVVVLFSVYSVDAIGSGFVVFTSRGVKQCNRLG